MSAPTGQSTLPTGLPLAPGALDTLPSDWAEMADAGTPYVAVVQPHDTHADVPVLTFVPFTSVVPGSTSPVTVEDGSGGFAIVFDNDGNVVFA